MVAATMTTTQSLTWTDAVTRVSDLAHARMPAALHSTIERATALVLDGDVVFEEDGVHAMVRGSDGQTWYAVNGTCPCKGAEFAPDGLCKHKVGTMSYKRAAQLQHEPLTTTVEETTPAPAIHPEFIVTIQGKRFVRFAGLLQLAQAQGLTSLHAQWTYNDAELSLATATATFADGRTYTEAGDASPSNTSRQVAAHFRRVALTRAKARVLRDAVGCDLVAVEELGDAA